MWQITDIAYRKQSTKHLINLKQAQIHTYDPIRPKRQAPMAVQYSCSHGSRDATHGKAVQHVPYRLHNAYIYLCIVYAGGIADRQI